MKDQPETLAYPCGNIAKYFLDDEFLSIRSVETPSNVTKINDEDIAFPVDVTKKFQYNEEVKELG